MAHPPLKMVKLKPVSIANHTRTGIIMVSFIGGSDPCFIFSYPGILVSALILISSAVNECCPRLSINFNKNSALSFCSRSWLVNVLIMSLINLC